MRTHTHRQLRKVERRHRRERMPDMGIVPGNAKDVSPVREQ